MLPQWETNVLTDGHAIEQGGVLKNKTKSLSQVCHVSIVELVYVLTVENHVA